MGPPPEPVSKPYVIPADANVFVTVSEAVASQEEDIPAYLRIFIDGVALGQTPTEPKSKEKKWGEVVAPGNHLFRFEHWIKPIEGEWTPLAGQWQPPERFIRVDAQQRMTVALKFLENGRRFTLQVSRQPAD